MDETYDPDDQFFQSFKAGYYAGLSDRQIKRLEALSEQIGDRLEEAFWNLYLGWQKS